MMSKLVSAVIVFTGPFELLTLVMIFLFQGDRRGKPLSPGSFMLLLSVVLAFVVTEPRPPAPFPFLAGQGPCLEVTFQVNWFTQQRPTRQPSNGKEHPASDRYRKRIEREIQIADRLTIGPSGKPDGLLRQYVRVRGNVGIEDERGSRSFEESSKFEGATILVKATDSGERELRVEESRSPLTESDLNGLYFDSRLLWAVSSRPAEGPVDWDIPFEPVRSTVIEPMGYMQWESEASNPLAIWIERQVGGALSGEIRGTVQRKDDQDVKGDQDVVVIQVKGRYGADVILPYKDDPPSPLPREIKITRVLTGTIEWSASLGHPLRADFESTGETTVLQYSGPVGEAGKQQRVEYDDRVSVSIDYEPCE